MHACAQFSESGSLTQQPCRPQDQIVLSAAEFRPVTAEGEAGIRGVLTVELIGQIDALHDHGQFMESITPQAQHFQMQVDLGRSADADRSRHEQDAAKSVELRRESGG